MDVKGLAAIVTGGASGLGGATASALAAKGAKVAIVDRNAELGEKKAQELGGKGPVAGRPKPSWTPWMMSRLSTASPRASRTRRSWKNGC